MYIYIYLYLNTYRGIRAKKVERAAPSRIYVCMYTDLHVCTCTRGKEQKGWKQPPLCIYTCIHMYIYTYIHIYIWTYTYRGKRAKKVERAAPQQRVQPSEGRWKESIGIHISIFIQTSMFIQISMCILVIACATYIQVLQCVTDAYTYIHVLQSVADVYMYIPLLQCVSVVGPTDHPKMGGVVLIDVELHCEWEGGMVVCCSVLLYVVVCCSMLQYSAVCCSVLQCVAVCCSVLQCVAVCCSVLCFAVL